MINIYVPVTAHTQLSVPSSVTNLLKTLKRKCNLQTLKSKNVRNHCVDAFCFVSVTIYRVLCWVWCKECDCDGICLHTPGLPDHNLRWLSLITSILSVKHLNTINTLTGLVFFLHHLYISTYFNSVTLKERSPRSNIKSRLSGKKLIMCVWWLEECQGICRQCRPSDHQGLCQSGSDSRSIQARSP